MRTLPEENKSDEKKGEEIVHVNMIKKNDLDNVYDKYLSHSNIKKSYETDFYEQVLEGKNEKFHIKMGVIVENKSGLDVLPRKLYQIYISYIHGLHSHRGQDVTQRLIRENYFITGLKKLKSDIGDFINSCLNCLTGKSRNGNLFQLSIQISWQLWI